MRAYLVNVTVCILKKCQTYCLTIHTRCTETENSVVVFLFICTPYKFPFMVRQLYCFIQTRTFRTVAGTASAEPIISSVHYISRVYPNIIKTPLLVHTNNLVRSLGITKECIALHSTEVCKVDSKNEISNR